MITALAGVGVLLLGAAPAGAQAHAVSISAFAFQPQRLTVQLGDTVTWQNADPVSHTATADGVSPRWNTGTIGAGTSSAAVLMATAGSFPYHCAIHPGMTGTIVVAAAATPAPTAPTSAPTPPPIPIATPGPTPTSAPSARTPSPTTAATDTPTAAPSPASSQSPSAAPSPTAAAVAGASPTPTLAPTAARRPVAPATTASPVQSGPGSLLAGLAVVAAALLTGVAWLLVRRR